MYENIPSRAGPWTDHNYTGPRGIVYRIVCCTVVGSALDVVDRVSGPPPIDSLSLRRTRFTE